MNLDELYRIIGDIPVSEQIDLAIHNHAHPEYASANDVEDLKKKIELLFQLIGDTPVAEQIDMAIKK